MMTTFPAYGVNEFYPVAVYGDDVLVTAGVLFSVVADGQPPGTFSAARIKDGKTGITVGNLAPGTYRIHAKILTLDEEVGLDGGTFRVV